MPLHETDLYLNLCAHKLSSSCFDLICSFIVEHYIGFTCEHHLDYIYIYLIVTYYHCDIVVINFPCQAFMVKSDKLHLNLWYIVYFLGLNVPGLCLKLGLVNPKHLNQALVVQKVDSATQQINHSPADDMKDFVNTYTLDSAIHLLNTSQVRVYSGTSISFIHCPLVTDFFFFVSSYITFRNSWLCFTNILSV